MVHSTNASLMLEQRRRRWPNINLALVECTMFVEDGGPTLNRYWAGRPSLCVPDTSYRRVH